MIVTKVYKESDSVCFMVQNICARCGNAYHDLYKSTKGYCSECEKYRREEREKVKAELQNTHKNDWGNYVTCSQCKGEGTMGVK